jgi:hypothetical protein
MTAGLIAIALGIGSRLRTEWRAVTLAVVCAVFYGVTASLRALAIGGIGLDLFKRWELHAIAAFAPVSFLLNQNAFQSGRFGSVAVATITIADPAVSIGLGVAWLGESLASGLWWTVGRSLA